jgi:hypothetical protein
LTGNLTVSSAVPDPSDEDLKLLNTLMTDPPLSLWGDASSWTFNFRDSFNKTDTTDTPLQFLGSKKADCRAFYIVEDIADVSSTWERIASGQYTCVDGGRKGFISTVLSHGKIAATKQSSDANVVGRISVGSGCLMLASALVMGIIL